MSLMSIKPLANTENGRVVVVKEVEISVSLTQHKSELDGDPFSTSNNSIQTKSENGVHIIIPTHKQIHYCFSLSLSLSSLYQINIFVTHFSTSMKWILLSLSTFLLFLLFPMSYALFPLLFLLLLLLLCIFNRLFRIFHILCYFSFFILFVYYSDTGQHSTQLFYCCE